MRKINLDVFGVLSIASFLLGVLILIKPYLSGSALLGWDTPAYVYGVRVLEKSGFASFLSLTFDGSQGIIYYLILYLISALLQVDALLVDRVLPVALGVAVMLGPAVVLSKWFPKTNMWKLGLFFSSIWFAPYILSSNLHSNLIGFLMILFALIILPDSTGSHYRKFFLLVLMVGLASLAHPLTSIFFSALVFLAQILIRDPLKNLVKPTILILASFSTALFSWFASGIPRVFGALTDPFSKEVPPYTSPLQNTLSMLGAYLLPLVFLSMYWLIRDVRSQQDRTQRMKIAIILLWSTLTIVGVASSYYFNILSSYADRLLILFPLPFLLSFVGNEIWKSLSLARFRKTVLFTVFLTILIPNVILVTEEYPTYATPFVSHTFTSELSALAKIKFAQEPIFVMYGSEKDLANYADLWRTWVGAYIGPNLVFLGKITDLLNHRQTYFSDPYLQGLNERYFAEILKATGNLTTIDNHNILVIDSLYNPLTAFDLQVLQLLQPGIYHVVGTGTAKSLNHDFIWEAFQDYIAINGPWYSIKRSWSIVGNVMEIYSNVTGTELLEFRFTTVEAGYYSVGVRLYDSKPSYVPLSLSLDGRTIIMIKYNDSLQPISVTTVPLYLQPAIHTLIISPAGPGALFADIDYLWVSKLNS